MERMEYLIFGAVARYILLGHSFLIPISVSTISLKLLFDFDQVLPIN
jgi:hypothetical protein